MSAAVNTCTVAEAIASTLRRAIGNDKDGLKTVAQAGEVSTETARNWLDGRNAPTLGKFALLCRRFPEMKRLALDLCDLQVTRDPEFDKKFMEAMQAWSRLADRQGGQ